MVQMTFTRRTLLRRTAAGLPALLTLPASLRAAEYDLVIRNGRVIDPAQNIDRLSDVAIRAGKIEAIRPNIPADAGAESLEARGMLVMPGLIDIHLHCRDNTLQPPEILSTGVTTMVDAGSRGADNFGQVVDIAKGAPNRMRMMINISRLGNNPNPEPRRAEFLDGVELADVGKARAAIEKNRQWIVGMKARLSQNIAANHDLEVLRLAVVVHRTLGCRGVSRSDFRYDASKPGTEGLYFLEVNNQPGMTPLSLVPEQAAYCGISYRDFVSWMVENASWQS